MRRIACVLIALALCPAAARGDVINYGDFSGDTVSFFAVTESSLVSGPLYDAPVVSGNSLTFPGTGFNAQALNEEIDFVNGRLTMTIKAADGFRIDSIDFFDAGSFFGFGDSVAMIANAVGVVDRAGQLHTGEFTFSQLGAGSGPWSGGFTISFPKANQVTFTVDDRLLAFAGLLDSAFIDKLSIRVAVNTVAIPEPTTTIGLTALVTCYLVLAVLWRRRHQPAHAAVRTNSF
jgi:hypothetical protein